LKASLSAAEQQNSADTKGVATLCQFEMPCPAFCAADPERTPQSVAKLGAIRMAFFDET
jgi:hypothetical protein